MFQNYIDLLYPQYFIKRKNDKQRLIINLKEFTKSLDYAHFKMDDLKTVLNIRMQGYLMTSVELEKFNLIPFQ